MFSDNPTDSDSLKGISWIGLRHIITEIIYGSYINDDYDRTNLSAMVDYWIGPNATKREFEATKRESIWPSDYSILKTHILYKWVCCTETNTSSLISFHYALLLNADWVDSRGKRTILKFERWPRTCLGPQTMFTCPLNLLYHSARQHMERNCESHHWNDSLCAADLLMTIVSL